MVASREMARAAVAVFDRAAEINARSRLRHGNVVELSSHDGDDVVVAGDLHGHRLNFYGILRFADLKAHPRRHLVLQEVCHGGPTYPHKLGCMSHLLLEDIARLTVEFGDRIHFLLSNHELAELTDFPISKGTRMLNLAFRSGMQELYGDSIDDVRQAAMGFVASSPLAVRLATGIFLCHSIPEGVVEQGFDATVFERPLESADLQVDGAVFRLVWGRDYRETNIRAFARQVQADYVIQGHERCPDGAQLLHDCHVILDCCAENACVATLPLTEKLAFDQIDRRVIPLRPWQQHS